jgi:hypothetical protein
MMLRRVDFFFYNSAKNAMPLATVATSRRILRPVDNRDEREQNEVVAVPEEDAASRRTPSSNRGNGANPGAVRRGGGTPR